MKISNYGFIRCLVCVVILFTLVFSLAVVFFSKESTSYIILALFCAIMIFLIWRIQSVTYEVSGSCVTIRKYHPFSFKKFYHPYIELPQSSICNYKVSSYYGITKLTLKINTSRKKDFKITIYLLGFSNSQNKKIKSSLQTIVASHH
ncbi:hypothetical protein [Chryseobacterium echinoideorum]|uniref:hypothetical protein n=1 Tax=Chryseobacterium echinoideorum TaxID=1549648 RepID=UPI00118577D0|nr:hypothetical protein [Chryseobacterium echinoideorum]